jgi:exodeoxyribonuclease-3
MQDIRILCWNVNGIRAASKKGLLEWLQRESPDIVCFQETKAHPDQLEQGLKKPQGYPTYWSSAETKGYSGVATFTKEAPLKIETGFGIDRYDAEGRVIITEHTDFMLFNVYFPNGKKDDIRLQYKMDFYEDFLQFVKPLVVEGKKLVICGDYNTAHKEIDLARTKENEHVSGFLPIEREWIDRFIDQGFVDIFRHFNKEPHQYTWWDLKSRARERNVGWRIDYFFVTENLVSLVSDAFILPDITGSDHCPIGITIRVS